MTNDGTAPTPEAGSDLGGRVRAALAQKHTRQIGPNPLPSSSDLLNQFAHLSEYWKAGYDGYLTPENFRMWAEDFAAALILASPPPAEDLAGQGEPVAMPPCPHPSIYDQGNCCGLFPCEAAAPAPSRPADREEIARAIHPEAFLAGSPDYYGPDDSLSWNSAAQRVALKKADAVLALRDAPRTGGDGTQEDQR